MHNIKKLTVNEPGYPKVLSHLPTKAPKTLYAMGAPLNKLLERPSVAIVGTRRSTAYGERITRELAGQLAGQGIVIVSGLAYGIDAIAHKAALEAGGLCIAVLPSSLDNIVPVYNRRLADSILSSGGALVSEYPPGEIPFIQNFIARNRIMSGLAQAVLVTEAGIKSGALHTARFAGEQDKIVLAVPGNIYHPNSVGIHNLIKSNKAALVTELSDILHHLQLEIHTTKPRQIKGRNRNEQAILDLMLQGVSDGDELVERTGLDAIRFNQALVMLEIASKIRPLGNNHWTIY